MYMRCALLVFLLFSGLRLLLPAEENPFRLGLVANAYNEPALKPGATLGLDWEWSLGTAWKFGLLLPAVTYFYFPHNEEAFSLYPETALRYVGRRGFFFAVSAAGGLYLSRKIVPVYNLQGERIDDPFTRRLVLMAQIYCGLDSSRRPVPRPFRAYLSLGWKGVYPNNLGFQNQPMMQLGVNYRIRRGEKDE